MKNKHGLSGIYFLQIDKETGKREPVVFEDLEPEEQERVLNETVNEEGLYRDLIIKLANTLYKIGEEFDIYSATEKPTELIQK